MVTCSAIATLCSTERVGFAPPVSRLAQVARGRPDAFAICCCVSPRMSRNCLMFLARWDASSSVMPHRVALCQRNGAAANPWARCRYHLGTEGTMDLKGTSALVTGASRGLGAALVHEL